jgi:hypothetical protein
MGVSGGRCGRLAAVGAKSVYLETWDPSVTLSPAKFS